MFLIVVKVVTIAAFVRNQLTRGGAILDMLYMGTRGDAARSGNTSVFGSFLASGNCSLSGSRVTLGGGVYISMSGDNLSCRGVTILATCFTSGRCSVYFVSSGAFSCCTGGIYFRSVDGCLSGTTLRGCGSELTCIAVSNGRCPYNVELSTSSGRFIGTSNLCSSYAIKIYYSSSRSTVIGGLYNCVLR